MRTLTRRRLLGSAAAALALAGCGRRGASRRPWEEEPASTEGLWGFVDASGSWALPPRWHEACGSVGGLKLVQYGDEGSATEDDPPRVGLLGDDGEMAFDPVVGDFGGELAQGAFAVDTDWEGYSRSLVFYGTDGRRVAPAGDWGLEDASPFRPADALFGEPYALARLSPGGWGALSLDGSWLMRPERLRGDVKDLLYARTNESGLLVASTHSLSGPWGVADASGSWVVGPRYDDMTVFRAGHGGQFAGFEEGGLWGLLAQDGSVAVPAAYGRVERLADADLCLARDPGTGLWGTLRGDLSGWEAGPRWSHYLGVEYTLSPIPSAGPLLAQDGGTGLWGVASPGDGSWLVAPRWGGRSPSILGGLGPGMLAAADPEGGLWGVADAATGEWSAQPAFGALWDLGPGLACARGPDGGPWGLVDASGSWAAEPAFKEFYSAGDDGLIPARSAS